jgi:hypothetical protein
MRDRDDSVVQQVSERLRLRTLCEYQDQAQACSQHDPARTTKTWWTIVHIINGVVLPSWVTNNLLDRFVQQSDLSTLFSRVLYSDEWSATVSGYLDNAPGANTHSSFYLACLGQSELSHDAIWPF